MSESAIGGFSDFADLSGDSSPNLLTFFRADTVEETRPQKDEKQKDDESLYQAGALDGAPKVPRFSRREALVNRIVAEHPLIARAFVNRIWAILLGRGIVHPFDEMDSSHPPSHPELLDNLASDFRSSGCDIRRLIRIVLNSQAYQLDSKRADNQEDPAAFSWYLERPLTAEQYARSLQLAVRGRFQNDHALVDQIRQKLPDVLPDENVTGIRDALFLTNNPAVNSFIAEGRDAQHLVDRLSALPDHAARADEIIRTLFHRAAVEDEREAIRRFLAAENSDNSRRLEHLIWSLVTSAEFRFNH